MLYRAHSPGYTTSPLQGLCSKPCNHSPQHPTNYTEQHPTNHHCLHTNHLHYETQVLTLHDHINMRGTQFLAAAISNPDHQCHYMLAHQPTPRSIKTTPQALYTGFLKTIPQHSSSHIHMHFTNLAIQKLGPNTILGTPPPEIHHSELALPHADRVNTSAGFVAEITLLWLLTERE